MSDRARALGALRGRGALVVGRIAPPPGAVAYAEAMQATEPPPPLFARPVPPELVVVTVHGLPVPQGSMTGFVPTRQDGSPVRVQGGRILVNIVPDNAARLRPWRRQIRQQAQRVMAGRQPLTGPLLLAVTFTMPKPSAAPKRRRTWPDTRPDLDKLLRALLDGLDEGGVYGDDCQVVAFDFLGECFPGEPSTDNPAEHPLPEPGVHATIRRLAWAPGEAS